MENEMKFNNINVLITYVANAEGVLERNQGQLIKIINNVAQFIDRKTNKTAIIPLNRIISIREQ